MEDEGYRKELGKAEDLFDVEGIAGRMDMDIQDKDCIGNLKLKGYSRFRMGNLNKEKVQFINFMTI